jgi:putative acetyltransferase
VIQTPAGILPAQSAAPQIERPAIMQFRESTAAEVDDVLRIHRLAFQRDDEAALVARLLLDPSAQPSLSLLAEAEGEQVGHVLFTALRLVGTSSPVGCALMAPLAVLPSHQRSGVGRGLIEHGCRVLAGRGIALVFVLGDPRYYTRCGFRPAIPAGLHAPFAIKPEEAWMARALCPDTLGSIHGTVQCAHSLADEQYWRE